MFQPSDESAVGTDGELIRALNASQNQNRTIRFEHLPIKVYLKNVSDGRQEVMAWTEATDGVIQFEFVDGPPEVGISVQYGTTNPIACGATHMPEWSEGRIQRSSIEIDPKDILPIGKLGCKQTVKHEIGHALGLLGHTADGGLMDPDGGNGEITPQVKRVMTRLYQLPPNTDVTHDP